MDLIVCTGNRHKFEEMQAIIASERVRIYPMSSLGPLPKPIESGSSFAENARIKADTIFAFCGKPCFADDSGLVVDALGGEPGVHSARYAGEKSSDQNNIALLLQNLKRSGYDFAKEIPARFICTIAYIAEAEKWHFFEGKLEGAIIEIPAGVHGFGYDPIFKPRGFAKTLAELAPKIKNRISHRAIALKKLLVFLERTRSLRSI